MADEEKTEEPSQKKLDKARQEGNVISSTEVKNLAALLGILGLALSLAPWLMAETARNLRPFLARPEAIPLDPNALQQLLADVSVQLGLLILVPFTVFTALGVAANVVQHGFLWVPKKLQPSLKSLNILQQAKEKMGTKALIEIGRASCRERV